MGNGQALRCHPGKSDLSLGGIVWHNGITQECSSHSMSIIRAVTGLIYDEKDQIN